MAAQNSNWAEKEIEKFQPKRQSIGLFQIYPPYDPANPLAMPFEPSVDVVFVHGLGGDCIGTWKSKQDGTVWPRELLPRVEGFQKARIFSFGYDATAFLSPFEKETKGSTFQFAESLLDTLTDYRLGAAARARSIVFIGHSLGGIVIKAALRHAQLLQDQFGNILDCTKAIVFFGTPHQGADVAAWATLLGVIGSWMGLRNSRVVEELKRWSDPLVQLARQFKELPSRYDIKITSFYETQATAGQTVVHEASACMNIPQERSRALKAEHGTMCKFYEEDPLWRDSVQSRFQAIAVEIGITEERLHMPAGTSDMKEFE